jgi:membrane-bound serine protease (ClpP class)
VLTWVIIFFIAGIILIFAEFLLPGGVCGGAGALMIIASAALALYHYPDQALWIIGGETIGVIAGISLGIFALSKGMGKALVLDSAQDADEGYINAQSDAATIGATGETMTALRPAGTIIIDGERIDAVSDGNFIDMNTTVRVVEVQGNRVVVEAETIS